MSAENLLGLVTPCGWEVVEKVDTKQHSGGNFCVRYLVRDSDGVVAFLKAMDLSRAFKYNQQERLQKVRQLISEYLFEREILNVCKNKKMTKVVIPISSGEIIIQGQMPPLDEVYYIVFERAESDFRQAFLNSPPSTWLGFFRALKHTCIGLEQLHREKIAHQDIKPSNILNFKNDISKVADLGRVVDAGGLSPFNSMSFAGDVSYAPIEIYYGVPMSSFEEKFLADLFGVGSLIYQTLMGTQITAALINEAILLSPLIKTMSYTQALPIYETAFFTLLQRLINEAASQFDVEIADAVANIVKEMCHPNYNVRGNPKGQNLPARLSIRRYTGKLNNLLRLLMVKGYK